MFTSHIIISMLDPCIGRMSVILRSSNTLNIIIAGTHALATRAGDDVKLSSQEGSIDQLILNQKTYFDYFEEFKSAV